MQIPLGIFEEITGLPELPPPADESEHDRRMSQRVPVGFRASISVEQRGGEIDQTVVMVRDISTGGVSILNEESLKAGTPFVMEFRGREDRPVKIRCAVSRCVAGGLEGTQYIVGASFEELLTKELPPKLPVEIVKPSPVVDMAAAEAQASALAENEVAEILSLGEDLEPAPVGMAPAAVVTPAAPVPAKRPSSLFSAGDPAPVVKAPADYFSPEGEALSRPAAETKAAMPVETAAPVFRVVPLPPDDEKESVISMELGPETPRADSSSPGSGKHHEILARVKELLVKQADQIKSQQQEIRLQRERWEKEVEGIRAELDETKQKLADLRSRADEDDQAIVDLASFVREHTGGKSSSSESEAA